MLTYYLISNLVQRYDTPQWLLFCDLNIVSNAYEKTGRNPIGLILLLSFILLSLIVFSIIQTLLVIWTLGATTNHRKITSLLEWIVSWLLIVGLIHSLTTTTLTSTDADLITTMFYLPSSLLLPLFPTRTEIPNLKYLKRFGWKTHSNDTIKRCWNQKPSSRKEKLHHTLNTLWDQGRAKFGAYDKKNSKVSMVNPSKPTMKTTTI